MKLPCIPWPHTDLEISPIAYGAMRFAPWGERGRSPEWIKKAEVMVEACLELGINFFDHADIYGAGNCEQIFGQLLKAHPDWRSEMVLQTKCGIQTGERHCYNQTGSHIEESINASLDRLAVEQIDVFLLHRPDPLIEPEVVAKAFAQARDAGKVRYFGVSNFSRYQMEYLQTALDAPLVANQVELSLAQPWMFSEGVFINRPEYKAVGVEGLVEYCGEKNVQIQAWSPLAGGALGEARKEERSHMATLRDVLAEVVDETGLSAEAVQLSWMMKHPVGVVPVVGTQSTSRLRACAAAASTELTDTQWWRLYKACLGRRLP